MKIQTNESPDFDAQWAPLPIEDDLEGYDLSPEALVGSGWYASGREGWYE